MRFLLFNIVVAGALAFLFTSDKADLQAAADRAHDAASDIKSKAFEVIGAKETAKSQPVFKPAPGTGPVKPVEKKPVIAGVRSATATPVKTEETFSQNKPLAPAAAEAVREVQVATRKLVKPLPPANLPTAVAQRREEVLAEGIVGEPVTEAQKFMPASTRKRDLMLLSEEMELFSAKSISR
ncbi:MAG: hypothetical protein ACI9JL_002657 [Paracoccaceae bacterium]|jgi:hypothetical protein